jgi:hypothetical protein
MENNTTNTVVMFFQYYICKFPLCSTKYMIKHICRQFKPWIKSFITLYQYFRLCNISYWALGCLGGLSLATWCKSILSIHIHYKCITYHIFEQYNCMVSTHSTWLSWYGKQYFHYSFYQLYLFLNSSNLKW